MEITKGMTIISALLLVVVGVIAAFAFVQIKDRTYFHSPPYTSKQDKASDVLVKVVFSRNFRQNLSSYLFLRFLVELFPVRILAFKLLSDD